MNGIRPITVPLARHSSMFLAGLNLPGADLNSRRLARRAAYMDVCCNPAAPGSLWTLDTCVTPGFLPSAGTTNLFRTAVCLHRNDRLTGQQCYYDDASRCVCGAFLCATDKRDLTAAVPLIHLRIPSLYARFTIILTSGAISSGDRGECTNHQKSAYWYVGTFRIVGVIGLK